MRTTVRACLRASRADCDGFSPVSVRRAQVEKILQTPDLLGLARSHKTSIDGLATSSERIQRQRPSYHGVHVVSLPLSSDSGLMAVCHAARFREEP